jgi:2-phosphoglycerate kinase
LDAGIGPEWRVLLLGGTTASGKSTTGRLLATALGIPCLSADSVWRAVLALTTAETHPALHQWPRPEVVPDDPEHLLKVHIEEAETLTPALEAFINWEMKEGNRFIFQGAWITPELAARLCASSNEVRAVFLDEAEESDIMASMLERSKRSEPDARQLVVARVGWLYGNWLRDGAKKHGLPLVAARPRETLVERIIAATR